MAFYLLLHRKSSIPANLLRNQMYILLVSLCIRLLLVNHLLEIGSSMPDSAPEEYKKLAERCCDADPDKRPDARTLWDDISELFSEVEYGNSVSNVWNTIYNNDVKPLSRIEKERKYSSKLLPTGDLPKPRNSSDLDSAAGMKQNNWLHNDVNEVNLPY